MRFRCDVNVRKEQCTQLIYINPRSVLAPVFKFFMQIKSEINSQWYFIYKYFSPFRSFKYKRAQTDFTEWLLEQEKFWTTTNVWVDSFLLIYTFKLMKKIHLHRKSISNNVYYNNIVVIQEGPPDNFCGWNTVLCLDISDSMRGDAFKTMIRLALRFISGFLNFVLITFF